jgi:hypothetical protein
MARKAGISDAMARDLWLEAQQFALGSAPLGSAKYCSIAMDRLTELIAAEALRRRAPFLKLSRGFRLQKRVYNAILDSIERINSATMRGLIQLMR